MILLEEIWEELMTKLLLICLPSLALSLSGRYPLWVFAQFSAALLYAHMHFFKKATVLVLNINQ